MKNVCCLCWCCEMILASWYLLIILNIIWSITYLESRIKLFQKAWLFLNFFVGKVGLHINSTMKLVQDESFIRKQTKTSLSERKSSRLNKFYLNESPRQHLDYVSIINTRYFPFSTGKTQTRNLKEKPSRNHVDRSSITRWRNLPATINSIYSRNHLRHEAPLSAVTIITVSMKNHLRKYFVLFITRSDGKSSSQ